MVNNASKQADARRKSALDGGPSENACYACISSWADDWALTMQCSFPERSTAMAFVREGSKMCFMCVSCRESTGKDCLEVRFDALCCKM
jgi:hypothetical protein